MADNKKDSTPINEEVLEETFGHYSEEMTSSSNGEGTSNETEQVAKKKSGNMIIYIGCAVVAVLYILYKVIFGSSTPTKTQAPQLPNNPSTPVTQSQVNTPATNLVASAPTASSANAVTNPNPNIAAPAENNVNSNNANNIANPALQNGASDVNISTPSIASPASNVNVGNTANPVNTNNTNGNTNGVAQGQDSTMVKDFLTTPNSNNGNGTNNTNNVASPAPNPTVNNVNTNLVNSAPVPNTANNANVPNLQLNHDANTAPTPVVNNTPSAVTDSSQVALLNSIKDMIGNQTTQLQSSIGGLASRVDRLEKNSDVSKLNSSINDIQARLAKLESKDGIKSPKTEMLPTTADNTSTNSTNATTEKKEVKYTKVHRTNSYAYTTKKHVWTKRNESKAQQAIENSDVLFTKQGAQPIDNTHVVAKPKSTYVIHSMIPGQIWIKNPDGTQSTYVVGDRLPNGDIIRKINVDKWSVETSSGVIR